MTDYERTRLLRVEENQERLRQLGIKKMANSLKILVDSQKTKKTKTNPMTISERDAKKFHEEVSGSVGASKIQHRLQFITPLSMNKYANLAKKCIVAPNDSRTLPVEEEGREGHETFADSNASKKIRLQQCEEANEHNLEFFDTSEAKKNHPRTKVTMGELLLNTKRSQIQKSALKRNARNSATTTTRRQLLDEEVDDEDVLRSQDLNERDIDKVGEHQSRINGTMGALLLNKKGSQMGALEKNATKPTSATTTISGGSRRQLLDEHTDDEDVLRSQVTIDELLLNTKGSQIQRGVLKKNTRKPNSATTSISSESRRQKVEEDNEEENDLVYQDLSEREEGGYEDDVNEDMEVDLRLSDDESIEDDENENIEFENHNNETECDGSEDEFENEDAKLEILQAPHHKREHV